MNRVSSVPPGARKYVDIGKVTNLMVVDLLKINMYVYFRFHLWVRAIIHC